MTEASFHSLTRKAPMRILPLLTIALLVAGHSTLAQTKSFNSSKSNTSGFAAAEEAGCNSKDGDCDDVGETIAEDHHSTRSDEGRSGAQGGTASRTLQPSALQR